MSFDASTLALTNGAVVSSWGGQTAAGTPTYLTAQTPNGRPAVAFNGSDRMGDNIALPAAGGDWILVAVIKPNNIGAYHNLADDDPSSRPMLWIDSAFNYELNFSGGGGAKAAGTGTGGWDIVIADSSLNQLYVNSPTANASGGGAVSYSATKLYDFFHRDGGQTYQGQVAELRIYNNRADFGGDFVALYNEMHTKWIASLSPPTQTTITTTSDVLNDGGLVAANNLGAGAQPVHVNGVCFGNDGAGTTNLFNGSGNFFTDSLPVGTPEMNQLLDSLVFQPNGAPSSLTIGGLTPGQIHRIQLFFSNDVNSTGNNISFDINGTPASLVNWIPNTVKLMYEFIPSATTAVVTFHANSSATASRAVLNAYAVHNLELPNTPCAATNNPPVANAGLTQTLECTGASSANAILNASASSDPDGDSLTYAWLWAGGSAIGANPTASFSLGLTPVALIVDDGNGETATSNTSVTVKDTTAPTVNAGADVTKEATGAAGAVFDASAQATRSDSCCGTSLTAFASATYALGSHTLTASASDCENNSASDAMVLTVVDTIAPVLTLPADIVGFEATGALTPVAIGAATATDIFNPVTVTSDAPLSYPLGTTVVTWTATDANGNVSTGTQNVNIVDTTAPVVTANLILFGSGDEEDENSSHDSDEGRFTVQFTVTDLVDASPSVTAVLNINGHATPITVTNGQIIEFEFEDEKTEVEIEKGVVEIEAPAMTFNVSATDASGNNASAAAQPQGLSRDNDDDYYGAHGKKEGKHEQYDD
ncbi:MAG: hypothetical protein Q9M16_02020 [Mariprofundus sp.]|nr:hypothetical protein [Mariprofundus sp.]